MGARALSPREREVDRSTLPSDEANNEWIYNPVPLIGIHGVDGDNFNFSPLTSFGKVRS